MGETTRANRREGDIRGRASSAQEPGKMGHGEGWEWNVWQRLGQSQPVGPVIPHVSWRAGTEPACMYVRYVGSPSEQSTAGANPPSPQTTPTKRKRPKRHWPAKDGPPTRPRRSRTGLRRAGDLSVAATLGFVHYTDFSFKEGGPAGRSSGMKALPRCVGNHTSSGRSPTTVTG